MKVRAAEQLAAEYAVALQEYLSGGGEVSLRRAYELGRRALRQGLGALDVVAAYQRCALQPGGGGTAATPEFARAMSFLAESLSPFEMILRGYQETNDGLRRRLDEVIRAQSQLLKQNESLLAVKRSVEDERQRYRKLLDLGPEAFLITDLEGVIREANTQAASLLYLPRQSLEGRLLSNFVDREQRDALQRHLRQLVAADSEALSEWRVDLRRADSTVVRVQLSVGVGTEGRGGGISDLLWLLRRVPKRSRRSEPAPGPAPAGSGGAASSDLLARASSVLMSSLDYEPALEEVARLAVPQLADLFFVHVLEPDGSIKQLKAACTGAAAELFADETERNLLLSRMVRSRPLTCLRSRTIEVLEQVTDEWTRQLADNADQLRALKRVGARSAVVAPLLRNGQPLGVFTLLRLPSSQEAGQIDLALLEDLVRRCALTVDRVRLSREAAAARSRAERASVAKDEFLAILSHELRNPLLSVLAWARILNSRKQIREEVVLSEGVQSIERNARHLARLADDCLDLVRISHGRLNVVTTRVDLNQVVLSSAEAVREMALSKQLEQAVVLSAEPLWLTGDSTRLEQAVVNLLVNAVKYTESNGRVVISSLRQGDWAEVQVTDSGIGIPPDQIETIFEPFSKGSSEWATSGSGLGLGLAIARKIVEMHGGAIRVESGAPDTGVVSTSNSRWRAPPARSGRRSGLTNRLSLPGRHCEFWLWRTPRTCFFS